MEENKRHIDDFLREELGDYTETPPPAVWDALEQRLDAPSAAPKGFNFRRLWWFIPALLFVAGGSYLAAHKWSQPVHVPEQAPAVIDSSSFENTTGPATNHTDTNFIDSALPAQPAAKPEQPVTKPAAADSNLNTQPASKVTVPAVKNTTVNHTGTATAKNQVKDQAAAPTHKDGRTATTASSATGSQPAARTQSNKTAKSKQQTQSAAAVTNNTATAASSATGSQPAATTSSNKTAKSKQQTQSTAAVTNSTTTAASSTTGSQPAATTQSNKTAKSKQQTQSTAAVTNNTATAASSATDSQPAATSQSNKTAKSKQQTQPATAVTNNTVPTASSATGSHPASRTQSNKTAKSKQQTQSTAAITNNTATAASSATGSQPAATSKTTRVSQKQKTQTAEQEKTPANHTAVRTEANTKRTSNSNRTDNRQQPPIITPSTPDMAKKGITVNSAANGKKNNRPGRQQAPETAKNTTPAIDKAPAAKPMVTPQSTARNQPAANTTNNKTQPAPAVSNNNHSGESGNNRDYTFKSKTASPAPAKPKDNLDLSAAQAKAEADTAEEKEMDPYASLNPPDNKKKPMHLEGGIKAAYTYGFNDYALNKISVLPYAQLNISTRLSVALHLGFSYGQMKKTDLDGGSSYYHVTPSLQVTSALDTLGGQLDTLYTYRYKQLRDSFAVKYTTAKSVWEIELPVVLKYNFSSSLSLFGGPVFTFGKVVQVNENRSNTYSRTITDSVSTINPNQYNIAYFNNKYQPSGSPDSLFSSRTDLNATSNPVRIGYTIGISYNTGRFTADLSLQQMLTSPGFILNETVRKTYTQPYIRLAVGFRIFK